ncbi:MULTISPECIES: efflux RND transporter periplasmic adaptor subunit [unclassified Anabaena]|uniref:efflux RND transporter periplasmic adaptor subunit n=1 Tax=unclassified Anabaena TaxID=2619674 RepID=UPI0014486415|nr:MULTISPECIES: efflux RND transporter periplasmic adaptor subunit [unclassified Anabaena]MTJ09680.1 efflux RND transporter periplasmic adaptor subunit [Anabaena sp. UHCC 0204]MTJ54037.1 efflux RND transporter periplasmic adaptor subunit [Anabaena sp. UHCC 0253]
MILDIKQSERKTQKIFIPCVLGLALLSASCGSLPKESAEAQSRRPQRESQEPAVDVAIARTNLLTPQPEYIGNTAPYRVVSVRSQVEGRLIALNLDIGDTVQRGKIISQLDDTLLLTALRQAEAELATTESEVARAMTQVNNARAQVERTRLELVQAQADSRRLTQLYKEGAIPEQSAQQAQTRAKTAAQALRSATEQVSTEKQAVSAAQGRVFAQKAAVSAAKERRSYARLISPITGVVTEKVTEPGNLLQPGSEVLKVADFSRVKVVAQVSELELAKIQVGQSAQVKLDAFPDQKFIGRVARISPTADTTARLIPVEIVMPNSRGKIGSGLLARVSFTNPTPQRVVVPATAISSQDKKPEAQLENTNSTLFVLDKKGDKTTVKERSVSLGKIANGKIEILTGLQPGESYIVRSSEPLKDGATVKLSMLSEN